jgi:hypothetical protein
MTFWPFYFRKKEFKLQFKINIMLNKYMLNLLVLNIIIYNPIQ